MKIDLTNKPLKQGTVYSTFCQTMGKGQKQNKWISEPNKNLSFSILFNQNLPSLENQFLFNQWVAVTLAEFLQKKTTKKISIKWPNDIYIENKKIAGILIENNIAGANFKEMIVGIGININQTTFDENLNYKATSLSIIENTQYILKELMEEIVLFFEKKWLQLITTKDYSLSNIEYNKILWQKNEEKKYKLNQKTITGKIINVDALGKLNMEINKELFSFYHGEIGFVIAEK